MIDDTDRLLLAALAADARAPLKDLAEAINLSPPATSERLARLRERGVKISMDDFGTGYSSLSYLRSFPFDKIKIDRCFISGLADGDDSVAIVLAIAGLAKNLGIATTAEGERSMRPSARFTGRPSGRMRRPRSRHWRRPGPRGGCGASRA